MHSSISLSKNQSLSNFVSPPKVSQVPIFFVLFCTQFLNRIYFTGTPQKLDLVLESIQICGVTRSRVMWNNIEQYGVKRFQNFYLRRGRLFGFLCRMCFHDQ